MNARDAATAISSRLGLCVDDPVLLSDSNNVLIWLRPSSVVAKVAAPGSRLALELAVATYLFGRGAPVIAPAPELPQEVHRSAGFDVTYWIPQPEAGQLPAPSVVAGALSALHETLRAYPGRLPSFERELATTGDILSDTRRAPAMPQPSRTVLREALDDFRLALKALGLPSRPLHGSPHGGNWVAVEGSVRFLDFETACVGPIEWDLAHLGDQVLAGYPNRWDRSALELCRGLVSAKTPTACWKDSSTLSFVGMLYTTRRSFAG